jgi:Golgi phosphoprotein 3 (GPP34)
MASLAGTGRLADDLYLIAHHDVSGRARLQPRAAGLGLAGGLLAELMVAARITVRPGMVTVTPGPDPGDELARQVLRQVAAEREQHGPRDWLGFLSGTAVAGVAERLGEAGYLSPVSRRRPLRPRWVPPDPDCAFAAISRGRAALDPGRRAGVAGAALAGLAGACGLGPLLMRYAPPGARRPEDAAAFLPPALQYLIAQTRAAVDTAVLAQRM